MTGRLQPSEQLPNSAPACDCCQRVCATLRCQALRVVQRSKVPCSCATSGLCASESCQVTCMRLAHMMLPAVAVAGGLTQTAVSGQSNAISLL